MRRIVEHPVRSWTGVALAGWTVLSGASTAVAQTPESAMSLDKIVALMAEAQTRGRTRMARKTRLVDARPARVGEVVVTMIKGEGKETQSRPAVEGDWVVRNRCPETGNEQYLVGADKFRRYEPTGKTGPDGWRDFRPQGKEVRALVLEASDGVLSFVAPWGEPMVAKVGDALVQDPQDPRDVYRVARSSFACTYDWIP
jgi:hypothetical protein